MAVGKTQDLVRHTEHVRQLVAAGCVFEARRYLAAIEAGQSPELDHWRSVLAAGRVTVGASATGKGMKPDMDWLREHAAEYAGRSVALRDGLLIDADVDEVALYERVKGQSGLAFVRIPPAPAA